MKSTTKLYAKNPDIGYIYSLLSKIKRLEIESYDYHLNPTMKHRLLQYIENKKRFKTLILHNDKIHNTSGPAVILKTDKGIIEEYWINGKIATEHETVNIKLKILCN